MLNQILEWLVDDGIDFRKNEENDFYYIILENKDHILLDEKRFKILNTTDEWKFLFGRSRVIKYEDEDSYEKLIEYVNKIKEESYIYNYSDDKVYVREITSQTSFATLIQQLEGAYFVIPKSQRNYVWSKEKVENLAISLIRGLPIPPLYAYRNDCNQLVILDGQQRLLSLYLYSKGVHINMNQDCTKKEEKNKTVNLKNVLIEKKIQEDNSFFKQLQSRFDLVNTNYKLRTIAGKTHSIDYKTLDSGTKALINFRAITIIEILVQGTDNKEEVYYNIFGNLNQGGEPLKNQELRDGIYRSAFYDMLHDINDSNVEKWRIAYGAKHNRGRDIELLLRFIATEYTFNFKNGKFDLGRYKKETGERINEFKSSYPKLLNDFSKIAMKFDEKQVNQYKNKILNFINRLECEKKVENLLLESLYIVDSKLEFNYEITSELIDKINKDSKYKETIGAGSSGKTNVEKRLNRVYKLVKEYIEEKNG